MKGNEEENGEPEPVIESTSVHLEVPNAESPRKTTKSSKKRSKGHQEVSTPETSRSGTPDPSAVTAAVAIPRKAPRSLPLEQPSMPAAARSALPLLICSVGNPGAVYANTLHSAGHTVLSRLAEYLHYPPFSRDRDFGNGLVSRGGQSQSGEEEGNWTLWQSTSFMNESGKGVRAAYTSWSRHMPESEEGKLVIVHDELEKPLGAVTLKTGQGLSAKGHNGLKSILGVMGKTQFARIGIGIGRPASRNSDDVAKYVLKKMTPLERGKIEACVEEVVAKLRMLEKG